MRNFKASLLLQRAIALQHQITDHDAEGQSPVERENFRYVGSQFFMLMKSRY